MTAPMATPPYGLLQSERKVARLERLRAELRTKRQSHETVWRDCAEQMAPTRAQWTLSEKNRGDRRNLKIIDSTPVFAARTLASGMHSGMTSPARPWFNLSPRNKQLAEHAAVKQWLHEVEEILNGMFHKSNLYQVLPTLYQDAAVFGTGAMMLLEDEEDGMRCYDFPVGTYYLALDSKRRVRVFVEEASYTVRQLVEEFAEWKNGMPALEKFSTNVQSMWRQGQRDTEVEVVHVIEPNREYDPNKLEAKFKRFKQCYYEHGTDKDEYLRESGFDEFPVMALRWGVSGNDVYGTDCPGIAALGDCKQLQLQRKRGAQGLDKMVTPPLLAPPEFRQVALSSLPGDVSYGIETSDKKVRPIYEVNLALRELAAATAETQWLINRAFFVDVILMLASSPNLDSVPKTAREIEERHEEKLLVFGPVLEQANQDALGPIIDRAFGIALRRGEIPPPPPELEGEDLRVEYVSIMAQAQKRVNLGALDDFTLRLSQLAVAFPNDPSVGDKADLAEIVDLYGDALSIAPKAIRSDEDVAAMQEARAEAQQRAEAAAIAEQAAGAAKQLSETDMAKPSALRMLTEGLAA